MNKDTWYASDICDDGKYGIVNGDNGIIIGWGSGLSYENCKKIADRHNECLQRLGK